MAPLTIQHPTFETPLARLGQRMFRPRDCLFPPFRQLRRVGSCFEGFHALMDRGGVAEKVA